MQALSDSFVGNVQLSMGFEEELNYFGTGGRTMQEIQQCDMEAICRISPHLVTLMVGTNNLCDPGTSALKVAS